LSSWVWKWRRLLKKNCWMMENARIFGLGFDDAEEKDEQRLRNGQTWVYLEKESCKNGAWVQYFGKYLKMHIIIITLDSLVSTECICVTPSVANSARSLPPSVTADVTETGLPVTTHRFSRAESIPSTGTAASFAFNINISHSTGNYRSHSNNQ